MKSRLLWHKEISEKELALLHTSCMTLGTFFNLFEACLPYFSLTAISTFPIGFED